MRDATLVTTQDRLDAAVFRMQGATRIALDTEFMRERTYYAQLCLVQVATDADCFLVDPCVGLELGALHALLADRSRPKILHAARQDLEVLFMAGGRVPGPVFDTQVAAALLGLPPQVGYAELVARQLGHSIDKAQTRTDWSRRPLTPEQLAYAADDVHHLLQLHTELEAQLDACGRAAWLAEDARAFDDESLYQVNPVDAWRRLKGLARLHPHQQVIARALAEWRERRAVAADKPRSWILADDALYGLASRAPSRPEELAQIPALPQSLVRKRAEELLSLIGSAQERATDATILQLPPRPTPDDTARVTRLQKKVRDKAVELGISPEVLATRRDVEALVFRDRAESPLLRGWRRDVIGDALLAMPGAGDQPPAARTNSA